VAHHNELVAPSSEWTVDQRRRLINRKVAHVTLKQLEFDTILGCADTGLLKHGGRAIDADDWPADRSGDRNGNAAIPHREFYHGPVSVASELDIEADVGGHVRGPLPVPRSKGLRPAHRPRLARLHAGSGDDSSTKPEERKAWFKPLDRHLAKAGSQCLSRRPPRFAV
jgi:hypothetical protein